MLSLTSRAFQSKLALRTRTFCSAAPRSNVFVGNLSWDATRKDLADLFSEYGTLTSVRLMVDRETGRSRGFAFVNFENTECASAAIEGLNGKEFQGRALRVAEASTSPRTEGHRE